MNFLIEEYGQAIVLIIFGSGCITCLAKILAWVISNNVIV